MTAPLCLTVFVLLALALARVLFERITSPATGVLASMARGVYLATEPVLALMRSVLHPVQVGSSEVDLSPWIVVLLLTLLAALVCR